MVRPQIPDELGQFLAAFGVSFQKPIYRFRADDDHSSGAGLLVGRQPGKCRQFPFREHIALPVFPQWVTGAGERKGGRPQQQAAD